MSSIAAAAAKGPIHCSFREGRRRDRGKKEKKWWGEIEADTPLPSCLLVGVAKGFRFCGGKIYKAMLKMTFCWNKIEKENLANFKLFSALTPFSPCNVGGIPPPQREKGGKGRSASLSISAEEEEEETGALIPRTLEGEGMAHILRFGEKAKEQNYCFWPAFVSAKLLQMQVFIIAVYVQSQKRNGKTP